MFESGRFCARSCKAISYVRELAGSKVNIIWGTVTQENYDEEKIVVTLIATGMSKEKEKPVIVKKQVEPEKKVIETTPIIGQKQIEIVMPPFLQEAAKKNGAKLGMRVH